MEIRRNRFDSIRLKKLFKDKSQGATESEGSVTHLPFKRSPREEYTFENGRICLNGVDVLSLIDDEKTEIGFWADLASAVDEYRRTVWSRYGSDRRDFNGQTQGLLDKLLNKLTHAYEEMTGGIRVQLFGERLWVNDIDPKVVLALFLSNPTEDRRSYLKSIRTKLALILEGKVGKSFSNGIMEEAKKIFYQIHAALENIPSHSSTPLLAAHHPLGR